MKKQYKNYIVGAIMLGAVLLGAAQLVAVNCTGGYGDCSLGCGQHGVSYYKCTTVGDKKQYYSGEGESSNFHTAVSMGSFCGVRLDGPSCDQDHGGKCGPIANLTCTTGPTE